MGKRLGSCGGAGGITPLWKRAAAGGLSDGFTRYSQIKYQVVVALFRDAVVEPHCRETEGLRGMPGAHPAPQGQKTELGKGRAGLFLLPPPLAIADGWVGGSLLGRGPQPWPQLWAGVQGSKVTSKSGTARGWRLAEVPGSCWAILGTGQAADMDAPSPLPHQERCPGTRRAQPGTDGAFFIFCS